MMMMMIKWSLAIDRVMRNEWVMLLFIWNDVDFSIFKFLISIVVCFLISLSVHSTQFFWFSTKILFSNTTVMYKRVSEEIW